MAYLLDTGTLAEVLRSAPSRHLVRRLASVPVRDRWTSVISVSQLLVAARRSQQPRLMQDIIRLVSAVKVAPFDLPAAQSFAKLRATVAPQGDPDDVMIAAIAVSSDFTLVTRRPADFSRFPQLRVEDWTG
ncbi:MAG TPA: PIN domain-containing protein [Candidatus Nanopelagicales bacterium]|nr:PIN domain-containing protein [Candidatus Nanopelagicales bacterium]